MRSVSRLEHIFCYVDAISAHEHDLRASILGSISQRRFLSDHLPIVFSCAARRVLQSNPPVQLARPIPPWVVRHPFYPVVVQRCLDVLEPLGSMDPIAGYELCLKIFRRAHAEVPSPSGFL